MKSSKLVESKLINTAQSIGYVTNSVETKTILTSITGKISASSFDSDKVQTGEISPFDNLIQIIDGKAEIVINDRSFQLETGQSIIIPAHARNTIRANVRFKMISTIIKSGYEAVS